MVYVAKTRPAETQLHLTFKFYRLVTQADPPSSDRVFRADENTF